jgi:hypothetical protein
MKKLTMMLMYAGGLFLGSCDNQGTGNNANGEVEIETREGTASDHGAGTGPGTGVTTTGDYDGETSTDTYTDTLVSDPEEVKDAASNTRPDGNETGNRR